MTLRHSFLALIVVGIWGLNFVVIDEGLQGVPPFVFLAMRFLLVVVPAILFVKPPGIGWKNILLIGFFLSFGQFVLLYFALAIGMPAGLASLVLQTQVVLSVIVSALILRETPSRRQVIGIVIGMAGLGVVIFGHGSEAPWLPLVVTLLAALSWAIGNVLSRRAKSASGLSLVVWSGALVPIPSLALALVVDGPAVVADSIVNLSLVAILSTVYTAVGASLIGYGIWNFLLSRYPTSAVAPFTLLIPIIGILTAWLVQGEVPTLTQVVGGGVMLAGLGAAVLQGFPGRGRGPRGRAAPAGSPSRRYRRRRPASSQ